MAQESTLTWLYDELAKDYAWRITELSNLKSIIEDSPKGKKKDVLLKSGLVMLYSHWEGFIKNASDIYYKYVISQNHTLEKYSPCFISIFLKQELDELSTSKKLKNNHKIIESFIQKTTIKPLFSSTSPVKTSNLNYDVFTDICTMIGIDIDEFETNYRNSRKDNNYNKSIEDLINKDLLKKRNEIAHGNYLAINEAEYKILYDIIINTLLKNFQTTIIAAAQNKLFLSSANRI